MEKLPTQCVYMGVWDEDKVSVSIILICMSALQQFLTLCCLINNVYSKMLMVAYPQDKEFLFIARNFPSQFLPKTHQILL